MTIIKLTMRFVFAAFFVAAGCNHFLNPQFYRRIIPPYLPWHHEIVILSGILEVVFGLLLCIPPTMTSAAWGLIGLLIAVFPANFHMAMHPELYPTVPYWFLIVRLPIQGLLIAWAFWFTRPQRPSIQMEAQ